MCRDGPPPPFYSFFFTKDDWQVRAKALYLDVKKTLAIALLASLTATEATPQTSAAGGDIGIMRADTSVALGDVVCVGEKMRYLTPSQTLDGAELQSLSTSSVADALKYFSGVQIKDYGGLGGLKTMNVRSLGAQHVGVYLDGIRITNAQNGQIDLGKYSLSNMESVSLCNANKSERLQSASEYASGATVYMRTRIPDESVAEVEYGHGSFGHNKIKTHLGLRGVGFLDYEWQRTDGDYEFRFRSAYEDTTGRRHNGDISFQRMEAVVVRGGLRAHAYYYNSERGLPGPVVRRLSDQWESRDRQWDQNLFIQASWRGKVGSTDLKFNGKYSFDYLHYRQDAPSSSSSMNIDNRYTQQDGYASAAASHGIGKWVMLTASADVRWSDLQTDVVGTPYVWRMDTKGVVSVIGEAHGAEINVAVLYTNIDDHRRGEAASFSRLTPMIMASYRRGAWVWRAFYKKIFRAPTLNDLYYVLVGRVDLRPEIATQGDLGADFRLGGMHVAIDLYHNTIRDKIVAMPTKYQFRWSMTNYGRVESDGVSLSAGYELDAGAVSLRGNVNYTWQRDIDRTDCDAPEYGNRIPYSPKHTGSAIVEIGWRGFSLCGSLLYTGERYCLVSNNPSDLLEEWQTVDVKLNKEFEYKALRTQISVECNNATDSRHEVIKRYPMPGRNWKFTIKLCI